MARIKTLIKEIMITELKIDFKRSRFVIAYHTYPINLVVFEKKKILGYFEWQSLTIGINKHLMFQQDTERLKNIIRHELAHYLTYIFHGPQTAAHGQEFHQVCQQYNWGSEVSKATEDPSLTLNDSQFNELDETSKLFEKIKKLLKLASSDNPHESALATAKANSLLLKYNLQHSHSLEPEEDIYMMRVLEKKRISGKISAIMQILQKFFVAPVLNYGHKIVYLEVVGTKFNVELANYVAKFLDYELDSLWKAERLKHPYLKGATAKKSFMLGVAKGHISKIDKTQETQSSSRDLVVLDHQLKVMQSIVYPKLRYSFSKQSKECASSMQAGFKSGQNLSINPGLTNSQKTVKKIDY
jgi:hypothetical protein